MIDFVSWLNERIGLILIILMAPMVPCIIMAFYSAFVGKDRRTVALYSFPCLGIIIVVAVFSVALSNMARVAVVNEVVKISSGDNFMIFVNGVDFEYPYELSTAFKEGKLRVKISGSSPVDPIRVKLISSKGGVRFIFWRDSIDQDVYWVEYAGFKDPHSGRFFIKTDLLNNY